MAKPEACLVRLVVDEIDRHYPEAAQPNDGTDRQLSEGRAHGDSLSLQPMPSRGTVPY